MLERVLRGAAEGSVRQEDVLAHLPIDGAFARIAPHVSLREARRQFEREYIASVLERHRWRMSEAARTLGIERANLYRKTRQLGIMRRRGGALMRHGPYCCSRRRRRPSWPGRASAQTPDERPTARHRRRSARCGSRRA